MQPLVTQPLSWIDQAPIHLSASRSTSASPAAVFAELADHERWPEWFPNVRRVEVIGPAEGVGARRRVHVPGMVVEEEFIAWDPGVRWAFTGTAAKPALFSSLVEDCQLTARADGGTDITYTMHLAATTLRRPLVQLAGGRIRKSIAQALDHLAARVEARG